MSTFVYSPDIKVHIADHDGGLIDVSSDVESFNLNRNTSAMSTFDCELNNDRKKYNGRIPRMARIVVSLKRIYWLQVFAGYTTKVPLETPFAGSVSVSAHCTLKLLEYSFWDPYTEQAARLMPGAQGFSYYQTQGLQDTGNVDLDDDAVAEDEESDSNNLLDFSEVPDGGAGLSMFKILTKVIEWEPSKIHIQNIPATFLEYATDMAAAQMDRWDEMWPYREKLFELVGINLDSQGWLEGNRGANADAGTVAGYGDDGYIARAASKAGFKGEDVVTATAISLAEWGGNPKPNENNAGLNSDGSIDYGLWQINSIHFGTTLPANGVTVQGPPWIYDVQNNADVAYGLFVRRGNWRDWVVYNTGAYKEYIERARQAVKGDSSSSGPQASANAQSGGSFGSASTSNSDDGGDGNSGLGGGNQMTLSARSWVTSRPQQVTGVKAPTWGMAAFVFNKAANLDITSAYRHGDPKRHGRGRALDLGSSKGAIPSNAFGRLNPSDSRVQDIQRAWDALEPYMKEGYFKEAIWRNERYWGTDYGPYTKQDHFDHMHLAIDDGQEDFMGLVGQVLDIASNSITIEVAGDLSQLGPGGATDGEGGWNDSPFNIVYNTPTVEFTTYSTYGWLNFLNTEPVLQTIQYLSSATMREFQSAPNGDFIAWFPDWFGIWQGTPAMTIRDIEIQDFSLDISDEALATHVATAGDVVSPGSGVTDVDFTMSLGVVTVEDESLIKMMLGVPIENNLPGMSAEQFLKRFGMRPKKESVEQIRDHRWEFLFGMFEFMKQWTMQFNTNVQLTFMPELYPGMRLVLEEHDLEVYVESVTHSGSRQGGFQTNAVVTAPVKIIDEETNAILSLEFGEELGQISYKRPKPHRPAGSPGEVTPI